MDDFFSANKPFESLTSFYRSFSKRSRKPPDRPCFVSYQEVAPPSSIAIERIRTHRELAMEHTRAVLDHYLETMRRITEAQRRYDDYQQAKNSPSSFQRSQIALEEDRAWDRWINVIREALESAETEVVAVLRAWDAVRRVNDGSDPTDRGVIHQGKLYLAVRDGAEDEFRLAIVDLRSSMQLDSSVAVVDLVRSFIPQ